MVFSAFLPRQLMLAPLSSKPTNCWFAITIVACGLGSFAVEVISAMFACFNSFLDILTDFQYRFDDDLYEGRREHNKDREFFICFVIIGGRMGSACGRDSVAGSGTGGHSGSFRPVVRFPDCISHNLAYTYFSSRIRSRKHFSLQLHSL